MSPAQRATVKALQTLQAAARLQGFPWRGHVVRLAWYGSLEDYAVFRPDLRPEGHEEFARRTWDLEAAIKASGAKVQFISIRAAAFRDWLAAGEHPKPTAALRQQFINFTLERTVL